MENGVRAKALVVKGGVAIDVLRGGVLVDVLRGGVAADVLIEGVAAEGMRKNLVVKIFI